MLDNMAALQHLMLDARCASACVRPSDAMHHTAVCRRGWRLASSKTGCQARMTQLTALGSHTVILSHANFMGKLVMKWSSC